MKVKPLLQDAHSGHMKDNTSFSRMHRRQMKDNTSSTGCTVGIWRTIPLFAGFTLGIWRTIPLFTGCTLCKWRTIPLFQDAQWAYEGQYLFLQNAQCANEGQYLFYYVYQKPSFCDALRSFHWATSNFVKKSIYVQNQEIIPHSGELGNWIYLWKSITYIQLRQGNPIRIKSKYITGYMVDGTYASIMNPYYLIYGAGTL